MGSSTIRGKSQHLLPVYWGFFGSPFFVSLILYLSLPIKKRAKSQHQASSQNHTLFPSPTFNIFFNFNYETSLKISSKRLTPKLPLKFLENQQPSSVPYFKLIKTLGGAFVSTTNLQIHLPSNHIPNDKPSKPLVYAKANCFPLYIMDLPFDCNSSLKDIHLIFFSISYKQCLRF